MIISTGHGRLVQDPELRTAGDRQVASFRMAYNIGGRDDSHFLNVSVWGKSADYVMNYGSKGRQVFVSGSLKSRKYTNKDGVEVTAWEIDAREVNFLDRPRDDVQATTNGAELTVSEAQAMKTKELFQQEFDPSDPFAN